MVVGHVAFIGRFRVTWWPHSRGYI